MRRSNPGGVSTIISFMHVENAVTLIFFFFFQMVIGFSYILNSGSELLCYMCYKSLAQTVGYLIGGSYQRLIIGHK